MWWHSWLRHCATRRKVAGSIPDGVTAIFHWHNSSWGVKAAGAIVLKSGSLNLLEPSGPLQACNGILYLYRSMSAGSKVQGDALAPPLGIY